MSTALKQIEHDALALPAKARARLVNKLWESLGDTTYPVLSEQWQREIERRRCDLAAGKTEPVPGAIVSRKARDLVKAAGL